MIKKARKFLSHKRKVVYISHKGIISKEIGLLFCLWNIMLIFWLFFTTSKYFQYRQEIAEKDIKISQLTYSNIRLKKDLQILDIVKNYLESLNRYERFNTVEAGSKSFNLELSKQALNDKYSDRYDAVLERDDESGMSALNVALIQRINGIEGIIKNTGLNTDNIYKASYNDAKSDDGLKIVEEENNFHKNLLKAKTRATVEDNIKYLTSLEKFVEDMPLRTPVHNYYVTSGFGMRRDPFNKKRTMHSGIDMAGPINANIYSPSNGKVIYSGFKGGCGRTVEIDHGNGLVTEYGHLKKISVNKGDDIKKGQVIGVQGSTGKSTGAHVHYEIKQEGKPIKPDNFIKVGDKIF